MKHFRRSRCLSLGIIAVCMCASGCSWDDSTYDTFVSNGKVISCENMSAIQMGDCKCTPAGAESGCSAEAASKCNGFISAGAFENQICPREYAQCLNGICQLSPCEANQHMGTNGCEPDTERACGSADNDCLSRPGWAEAVCVNGACIATACSGATQLNEDTGTCDLGECIDGFLINGECMTSTVEQCGSSSNNCSITMPGWSDGACVHNICIPSSCKRGYHLNANADGCEGDTSEDCGIIGHACVAGEVCTGGECKENCGAGEVLCSVGNVMTCADPDTSVKYCGVKEGCTNYSVCDTSAGEVCVAGECKQYSCNSPETLCSTEDGNVCINLKDRSDSDDMDNHCGACNYRCSAHPIQNATSSICMEGECQYACTNGFINVGAGKTAGTIKCVNPLTDSDYCGATQDDYQNKACGDGEVCIDGQCEYNSCVETGTTLCSTRYGNECININSDLANHCGACNYRCSEHAIQNATSALCMNGACQYNCTNGFINVGSGKTSMTIRCVDPKTDRDYCGATADDYQNKKCAAGQVCVDGNCVYNSCVNKSETLCSTVSGNQCINVNSSEALHCGACNYKCEEHPISNATSSKCAYGKCQYTCASGFVNVGKGITADTILCIDPNTDREHCNAKGNANGAATTSEQKGKSCGSGEVCVDGACVKNSCTDESLTLCSTTSGNACINVNSTKSDHCGACNYKCSDHLIPNATPKTSGTCVDGKCQYACNTGYKNVGTGITADTILCIDPKNNSDYCGATGNASGAASEAQKGTKCDSGKVCVNSKCVINSCTDSSIPNLCVVNGANACVNTQSNDASHCGACNYKCASNKVPNATSSTCASGKCQYVCATVNNVKYVNVGTGIAAGTILCINPDTNPDYCGATGNASGSASTAQKGTKCKSGEVCVGGSCVINQCASNSSNPNLCVVDGVNVCKNVNSNDAEHCGACNYQCSAHNIPNATSNACAAGKCQYQCVKTNDVEYVNVGTGVTEDTILCIDPNIDSRYCGATAGNKGKSCPTGDVCVGGVCVHNSCTSSDFPDLCVVNKENVCVNIQSDADHCGACNYACENHTIMDGDSVVAKSTGCSAGHCLYECRNDLVNIGSGVTAETIRCIDPNNDSTHCGAKSASVPGVDCNNNEELHSLRGTCENGTCHITECGYGYHRVNGNPVTCELNTPKVCGVRDSETFDVDDCTPLAMPNKAICDLGGACFIGSCVAHAHEIESGCVCDTEYTSNDAKTQCISDADYCRDNSVTKCVNEGKTGMLYGCSENSWTEPTTCKNGYSCAENVCGVCVDDNTQCSGRMLQTCQDGDWTETECEADKICFEGACNVCDLNAHVFGNECETDDIANCGEHDYKCDDALIPHGKSFSCISKVCRVNSCSDGYHVHENGCEEDSIAHCGEHDHACEVDNADNTCRNGECVFTCLSGYHSYDGACEPDDRNNCGAHEIACQNTEICVSGSCKSCPANQHVYGETCEPDDRNNCGAHETTCQNTEICDSGSCKSCLENQHVYGDTCEPDDRDNCGAHGNACINNKVCRSGVCLDCEANSHAYENNCEPDDRNNCGAHENACTNNQVCLSGTCSDCGANSHVYENSCEANDGDNCGTHGNACGADNPAHSTVWGCNTNGVCIASSCEEGYHVYEGACEEDSITNCGSHGQSCTIQNGSPSCSTGVCKAASCDNGYHGYGNECEKDSNDNCGAHAYSCVEPSTCQNGQCQI